MSLPTVDPCLTDRTDTKQGKRSRSQHTQECPHCYQAGPDPFFIMAPNPVTAASHREDFQDTDNRPFPKVRLTRHLHDSTVTTALFPHSVSTQGWEEKAEEKTCFLLLPLPSVLSICNN